MTFVLSNSRSFDTSYPNSEPSPVTYTYYPLEALLFLWYSLKMLTWPLRRSIAAVCIQTNHGNLAFMNTPIHHFLTKTHRHPEQHDANMVRGFRRPQGFSTPRPSYVFVFLDLYGGISLEV